MELHVIDVSMPKSPTEVGSIEMGGSANGVAVAGDYAYVIGHYDHLGDGVGVDIVRVIDVSDPRSPRRVDSVATPGYPYGVAVAGNYVYVAEGRKWDDLHHTYVGGGLLVIDVSVPGSRGVVGPCCTAGGAWDVAVQGNYAYVVTGGFGLGSERELHVVDLPTPGSPTAVGYCGTPGSASGVAVAGNYAYVAAHVLYVIDVSNPPFPSQVGSCDTWGGDIAVGGNYAYIAAGEAGLRVIDVSAPEFPTEVGSCDTPGLHVAVAGNYAYVSAGAGLLIIDVSTPAFPTVAGSYETAGYASHVTVAGNHAYVAVGRKLLVIDVSTPESPITSTSLVATQGSSFCGTRLLRAR